MTRVGTITERSGMPFETERHDDVRAAVLHIAGDIDLAAVPELRSGIEDLVAAGYTNIVLELSRVDYADSTALGLLVWLDRELADSAGKVVLVGATRNVNRVLELSGLVSVAETICAEDTVSDALQGLEVFDDPGMPLWSEQLQTSATVKSLGSVRERVCALLVPLCYSETALFDVKVALGEALANAVRHGSPAGEQSLVTVRVHAFPDRIAIEVEDMGGGFDGEHVCTDDLYASGGRGIMFMKALMDRVVFSNSADGGTVVTLVKHRPSADAI